MAGNIQNDAPLIAAVRNNNTRLVKQLLAEGADPNIIHGEYLRTPLHEAGLNSQYPSRSSNTEIYNHLLLAGADQNIRDTGGHVPGDFFRWSDNLHNFEKKKKSLIH